MSAPNSKPSKVGQKVKKSKPVEAQLHAMSQCNDKNYGRSINQTTIMIRSNGAHDYKRNAWIKIRRTNDYGYT